MKLLIHSQTSTVQPLKFGNGYIISPTLYWACDYLSMLGLKLIHASQRPRQSRLHRSWYWSIRPGKFRPQHGNLNHVRKRSLWDDWNRPRDNDTLQCRLCHRLTISNFSRTFSFIFVLRCHETIYHPVECRSNAARLVMILHAALRWQQQNVNQRVQTNSRHPITRPHKRTMGCLSLEFWTQFDRVITEPHCTYNLVPRC